MQTADSIEIIWLMLALLVTGLVGLFGCWLLFRSWRRFDNLHRQQPPEPTPPTDLWKLAGYRLISEMDRSKDPSSNNHDIDDADDAESSDDDSYCP